MSPTQKNAPYTGLISELAALLAGERDPIANTANMSALLLARMADVNWVGFYFRKANELVVGPFQGRPACVRIELGKGVCGTAAVRRATVIVPDVHAFPGHIACDAASASEIVVPIIVADNVIGVLDVDSPIPNRFDADDAQWLEKAVDVLRDATAWDELARGGAAPPT